MRSFYESTLPPGGRYALFLGQTKQHLFFSTLDELACKTEALAESGRTDIYFATCTLGAEDSRSGDNALTRDTICFDIDAGPAKVAKHGDAVYATQKDAIAALFPWCGANDFVPHLIVSSGQGLHVYFKLDRALAVDEWKPLALAVKAKAVADGLKIDAMVTGDIVRVLRPAGTLHPSGNRVKVLKRTPQTYTPEEIAAKFPVSRAAQAAVTGPRRSRNAELLAPVNAVPRTIHRIVAACAAMAHVAASGGDVPEPYWRAALGIAKHTVEGSKAAHLLSQGSPDYDYGETEAKFERWTAGPSTCETFEAENPQACAGCPHRGKIKSPISLGRMDASDMAPGEVLPAPAVGLAAVPDADETPFGADADEAPAARHPWDGHLPDGTAVRPIPGGYGMSRVERVPVLDEMGKPTKEYKEVEVSFAGTPFWFEAWTESTRNDDHASYAYAVYNATRRTVTRFTMTAPTASRRDTLLAELAGRNIQAVSEAAKKTVESFVKASIERIRATGMRHKIADRFGLYTDHEGALYYAHGAHLIYPNGEIKLGGLHPKLSKRAADFAINLPVNTTGCWAPDVWDQHVRPRAARYVEFLRGTFRDDQPEFKLAIMLSLASPFIAFTKAYGGGELPPVGFTVSLASEGTGLGKTLCMTAAALGYGHWEAARDDNSSSSTKNFRGAVLAQCGTLPSFMDEAGDGTLPRDLHDLIKGIGNGQAGKGRMRSDGTLEPPPSVALVNLMATNRSIRELVASANETSSAAVMRMLEIDCSGMPKVAQEAGSAAETRRQEVTDTHGCFGALIHLRITQLGVAGVAKLMDDCGRVASAVCGSDNEGRILSKALAAMLALRRIMRTEGLELWDGKELQAEFKKWYDESLRFGRQVTVANAAADQVARMLTDLQAETLVTDVLGCKARAAKIKGDRVPSRTTVRIPQEVGEAYVDSSTMRRWCKEHEIGFQSLIARAQGDGLVLYEPDHPGKWERKVVLTRGVAGNTRASSRVVVFNLRRLGMTADDGLVEKDADIIPIAASAKP